MEKTVSIQTPFIKLDALLKYADIAQSGGEAKILIQEGLVFVNGEVCEMRGKKCVPGDRIIAEGVTISVVGAQDDT